MKNDVIKALNDTKLDNEDYKLLKDLIFYLDTQDYELLIEIMKSYLIKNNKLNYEDIKEIFTDTIISA